MSTEERDRPDDYVTIVFREMFRRVRTDLEEIDSRDDGWWNKRSWTVDEMEDFTNWMYKLCEGNVMAQMQLFHGILHRTQLRQAVKDFVFKFGWKVTDVYKLF